MSLPSGSQPIATTDARSDPRSGIVSGSGDAAPRRVVLGDQVARPVSYAQTHAGQFEARQNTSPFERLSAAHQGQLVAELLSVPNHDEPIRLSVITVAKEVSLGPDRMFEFGRAAGRCLSLKDRGALRELVEGSRPLLAQGGSAADDTRIDDCLRGITAAGSTCPPSTY